MRVDYCYPLALVIWGVAAGALHSESMCAIGGIALLVSIVFNIRLNQILAKEEEKRQRRK
jgi:hypothetical protein